jgi:hypothetical protein
VTAPGRVTLELDMRDSLFVDPKTLRSWRKPIGQPPQQMVKNSAAARCGDWRPQKHRLEVRSSGKGHACGFSH